MSNKERILESIDRRRDLLKNLSDQVWELAEVGDKEVGSAQLLAETLENQGFKVSRNTGDLETAFVAEYGSGGPVVGLLGEYDALPELSQAVSAQRKPLEEGGAGHGCGHNLLGVAAPGSALALKDMIDHGSPGTVKFFGCPAEETLSGKVIMAQAGAFDDLDVCLTWHPGGVNGLWAGSSLALNSAKFTFFGRTSHAAASPHVGRSALDAVELMNVGANYLREHVIPDARIHYVITEGGGEPNVVPSRAQAWYYVRGPKRRDVKEIYDRLLRIAEGACLMTETTHQVELLAGCYDYLPNAHLSRILWEEMHALGGPGFDEDDLTFAQDLAGTLDPGQLDRTRESMKESLAEGDQFLHSTVGPWREPDPSRAMPGSTDVGDVSWLVPTSQIVTACAPLGVAGHTWQFTASSGSSVGIKGMMLAARVMALAGYRLLNSQQDIEQAQKEFEAATRDRPYQSPLEDMA